MYHQTVTEFKKMLTNLDGLMVKAAAHADHRKFDVNNYVGMRLAPDMYPLVKQIQSVCDSAKFCASYLSGKQAPKHEDNETTWTELRARIKKATTCLDEMKPEDFKNAATMKVSPKWAQGEWLPGEEYVTEVAIPNFYFHMAMAYAILRHAGVDIGKMDYMGKVNFRK